MPHIIVECSNCEQQNRVETQKLKAAVCGNCKEKLVDEDVIPAVISDEEIAVAVADAPSHTDQPNVDISVWTSKIGNQEQQTKYVDKGFWSKVKKYASKVPFAKEAVAMYYCAMDSATPTAVKATAIAALAYWILPIDLIPDFIPIGGYVDDASAIFIAYKAVNSHITDEHRAKAEQFFKEQ
ncbi:YkvA family protein [Paenibacillus sp. strain BS8-2]